MDGHGCIVPVHISANTASLFGYSVQKVFLCWLSGKHTDTRSIYWKKSENSKWDILHPELPLLFCKIETKGNVSNSPKGNDSKNNPDDLLHLASLMFTTKHKQRPVQGSSNSRCNARHTDSLNTAGQGASAVSAQCCWGVSGDTWQRTFYTGHMPPTHCFPLGTTSTTPENMKEPLKTAKQSHSHFPANKIPVRISVKLPFGAVAQNSLLYIIMSFGFITKGRRLRYLQCWSRSASSSQLCICDLGKVIQLSNGWAVQVQKQGFFSFWLSCLFRL